MKKVKFGISLLLIIAMLAANTTMFSAFATETNEWVNIPLNEIGKTYYKVSGTATEVAGNIEDDTYENGVLTIDHNAYDGQDMVKLASSPLSAGAITVEVEFKFTNAYVSGGSRAAALVLGSEGGNHSIGNSTVGAYTFTLDRVKKITDATKRLTFRKVNMNDTSTDKEMVGIHTADTIINTTEWQKLSVAIDANGYAAIYLNDVCQGTGIKTDYAGGYIGIGTYDACATDAVSFRNLRYKNTASDNSVADSNVFNKVDLSVENLTPVGADANVMSNSYDTDGSKVLTITDNTYSEFFAITQTELEGGRDYTFEIQARFTEAYTSSSVSSAPATATASAGVGFLYDLRNKSTDGTWTWGNSTYVCPMFARDRTGNDGYSSFGQSSGRTGVKLSDVQKASTDWWTIRVTATADGQVSLYLNGEWQHTLTNTKHDGGFLAIKTWRAYTTVQFKNFQYANGIVTDESSTFGGDFDYLGASIRYPANAEDKTSGLRIKSYISDELLAKDFGNGGKIVEYGTLVAKADGDYVTTLNKGADGVKAAVAYSKEGRVNTVFEKTADGVVYTIALYNITSATQKYAFRAYYVVEYTDGTTEVFYQSAYGNANQAVWSLGDVAERIKASEEYLGLDAASKSYIDGLTTTA